jgi:hypothetical protein
MIVPAMNSKELLTEIFKDFEIVQRKAMYLTDGLRREAVKSRSKYVQRIYGYRSKQYNNWIIIVDYYVGDPCFTVVVFYVDEFGLNGVRVDTDDRTLTHFSPHFLQRYNERFVIQGSLSKLDLLKRFISNNSLEAIHYKSIGDTKQYEIFGRFKEGIGLGIKEVFTEIGREIIHYKTFISNEMIFDNQRNDFTILGKYYNEGCEIFQKHNKKRA